MTTATQSSLEEAAVSLEQVRQLAADLAAVAEYNLGELLAELKRDKPKSKGRRIVGVTEPYKPI